MKKHVWSLYYLKLLISQTENAGPLEYEIMSSLYRKTHLWPEHWWLVCLGWFEIVFFSPYEILPIAQKYLGNFCAKFLYYHENAQCAYSYDRGNSNEYIQHTIILKTIENTSLYYYFLLSPDMVLWLTTKARTTHVYNKFSRSHRWPRKFDCT